MLDPHGLLHDVHPDLRRVLEAAEQAPQPFQVTCGLRSLASERQAVATGHSRTLHSRHLPVARYGGVACAVDVVCLSPSGGLDWAVADAHGGIYGQAAQQVMIAALKAAVKLQWGGQVVGAWVDGEASHFRDWGHFQLDPSAYPGDGL